MALSAFLFKSHEKKKLLQLLFVDRTEASVRELSLMSGTVYATTYSELQTMHSLGLLKKRVMGKAVLYSSDLSDDDALLMRSLLGCSDPVRSKGSVYERLLLLGLPMVGGKDFFSNQTATDDEELVVKSVLMAKENSTLARSLPVVLAKVLPSANRHRLHYWAKKFNVKRELGFFVALTGHLTKSLALVRLSRSFFDKRWSRESYLLRSEENLKGFQAALVQKNTPQLAKKWKLRVNMGLDSFESMFSKFAQGASR